MPTFWVKYNFSEFNNRNNNPPAAQNISFLGEDLNFLDYNDGTSPVSGLDALPTTAESELAELESPVLINQITNSNTGAIYSQYIASSIDNSNWYLVRSKPAPKTLLGPTATVAS